MITAATPPQTAAKQAMSYALNNGGKLWVATGYREVECFVLKAGRSMAVVEDIHTGETSIVRYADIVEMTEL